MGSHLLLVRSRNEVSVRAMEAAEHREIATDRSRTSRYVDANAFPIWVEIIDNHDRGITRCNEDITAVSVA